MKTTRSQKKLKTATATTTKRVEQEKGNKQSKPDKKQFKKQKNSKKQKILLKNTQINRKQNKT